MSKEFILSLIQLKSQAIAYMPERQRDVSAIIFLASDPGLTSEVAVGSVCLQSGKSNDSRIWAQAI